MRTITTIHNDVELRAALDRSLVEPIILFKHSMTCPISAWAKRRIMEMVQDDDPPVYEIVVQATRAISNEVERLLEVRHESPQAIIVVQRQAVYDASHDAITTRALRDAVRDLSSAA